MYYTPNRVARKKPLRFVSTARSIGRVRGEGLGDDQGQRRVSFDIPLLPGYLFARCNAAERLALLRSGYLVRTIDVVDQIQLLDELRQIYLASAGPTDLTLYPQLKRGRKIRVVRGPLSGVSGQISSRKETFRLVLNVSILGTAVAAEVDMDDVELI